MKKENVTLLLALGIIIAIIILCNQCNKSKESQIVYVDTGSTKYITKDSFIYREKSKDEVSVKPQTQTKYNNSKSKTGVVVYRDTGSLVIKTRIDTFWYLTPGDVQYEDLVQTLSTEIGHDSLKTHFLLDGELATQTYRLNLHEFRYVLEKGSLKLIPLKRSIGKVPKIDFNSNAYLLYSPIRKQYSTAVDYYLNLKRFGIGGITELSTAADNSFNTRLGIRYTLK